MSEHGTAPRTLAVDIGGTAVKSVIIDENDHPVTDLQRVLTPHPATPSAIFDIIKQMAQQHGDFDRVSCGFPGVVRQGITETAHNLDPTWVGFGLQATLEQELGKPARVANDAAVQGLGTVSGKGVELIITLGTGVGSALFLNGQLVPNLELAHHPFRGNKTYEEKLGKYALAKIGRKRWNKRLIKAIAQIEKLFNYDMLYVGGGNAHKVSIDLPANVKLTDNVEGLYGGLALWRITE